MRCFWGAITFIWPGNFIQVHKWQNEVTFSIFLRHNFFYWCIWFNWQLLKNTLLLSSLTFCWWCPTCINTVNPSTELPRGPVGQILCLEKEVMVLEGNRLLLSPLLGCFFSWGFPDNSCAFGNNSTEKVCMSGYIVDPFYIVGIIAQPSSSTKLHESEIEKLYRYIKL